MAPVLGVAPQSVYRAAARGAARAAEWAPLLHKVTEVPASPITPTKAKPELQGAPGSTIAMPADLQVVIPMNLLQTEVSPQTQRVVH